MRIKPYFLSSLLLLQLHLNYPGCCLATVTSSAVKQETTESTLDRIAQEVELESVSDRSYDDLAAILEKDPSNYRAHLLLGNCYELLGLPGESYEQYQLALKYGPNQLKAIVGMIKAETKTGRMAMASRLVNDAMKRFPRSPEVKFWAGNFLYSQQKYPEAEALYKEAIDSQQYVPGLASALASIRFQQRRYAEAVTLAKMDLAKDPNWMLANEVAGLSLMKLHRYGEAVKPLALTFARTPFKSVIDVEYAQALYWQGDYVNALRPALIYLALTADLFANNEPAKVVLGRILRHVNERDLATRIDEVNKVFGLERSAAFHFSLGDVLDKYGFRGLAIEQYKQGLALQPQFGRGLYRLGVDLEIYKHNYPEALKYLEEAAALLPEDEAIQKHVLRLQDRWATYKTDWSWRLKDWLQKSCRNS